MATSCRIPQRGCECDCGSSSRRWPPPRPAQHDRNALCALLTLFGHEAQVTLLRRPIHFPGCRENTLELFTPRSCVIVRRMTDELEQHLHDCIWYALQNGRVRQAKDSRHQRARCLLIRRRHHSPPDQAELDLRAAGRGPEEPAEGAAFRSRPLPGQMGRDQKQNGG